MRTHWTCILCSSILSFLPTRANLRAPPLRTGNIYSLAYGHSDIVRGVYGPVSPCVHAEVKIDHGPESVCAAVPNRANVVAAGGGYWMGESV